MLCVGMCPHIHRSKYKINSCDKVAMKAIKGKQRRTCWDSMIRDGHSEGKYQILNLFSSGTSSEE